MSDDSHLRPGLPFMFLTQSMNYVPRDVVTNSSVPIDVDLSKWYYREDLERLKSEFYQVQEAGPASTEIWFNGLVKRGDALMAEISDFERFETSGDLAKCRADWLTPKSTAMDRANPAAGVLPAVPLFPQQPSVVSLPPIAPIGLAPGLALGLPTSHSQPAAPSDTMSWGSQRSTGTQKGAKSSRDRARNRALKKAEIVARCSKLRPPISLDMLERLEAFDAALQVPFALTESSWELLETRLKEGSRKLMMEDAVKARIRTAPVPGQFRPPEQSDEMILTMSDTPKRDRLCQIAEEFIKQKHGFGAWITYPNSPQFAAEVLLHVRAQYMIEQERLSTLQSQQGFLPLPPPGGDDSLLQLDDARWVYNQTIKPRTEQIRKDLFLCPICPTNEEVKYFAFESVIQHYASKHTTAFTRGNQKVSWKAGWPENPPFHPNPQDVHTPTPTVTHTPTLSHVPPIAASPGSFMPSTVPSQGWRSPDTMSLISSGSTNNRSSISGRWPSLGASAGKSMYEVQRDHFADSLLNVWHKIPRSVPMPFSLRLFLAISVAVQEFRTRYSNVPSLDLFSDCITLQSRLGIFQEGSDLRCGSCSRGQAFVAWDLRDLVNHFRTVHSSVATSSQGAWTHDMVELPNKSLIQQLQSDPHVPSLLDDALQDAFQTATVKELEHPSDKMAGEMGRFAGIEPGPGHLSSHLQSYSQDPRPQHVSLIYEPTGYPSREIGLPLTRPVHTTPENYDAPSIAGSSRSAHARPTRMGSMRAVEPIPSDNSYAYNERPFTQPESEIYSRHHRQFTDVSRDRPHIAGITQADYSPRGSPHIDFRHRDSPRNSAADDFLSTIDAQVDEQMSLSGPRASRSARNSHPASRSNSALARHRVPSPADLDPGFATTYEPHRPAGIYDIPRGTMPQDRGHDARAFVPDDGDIRMTLQPEPMERVPSRVVEFDHEGRPMGGEVYQDPMSSPVQLRAAEPRRVYDEPRQIHYRPHYEQVRTFDEHDRPYETRYYQPVQYYDPETGRSYIVERSLEPIHDDAYTQHRGSDTMNPDEQRDRQFDDDAYALSREGLRRRRW